MGLDVDFDDQYGSMNGRDALVKAEKLKQAKNEINSGREPVGVSPSE